MRTLGWLLAVAWGFSLPALAQVTERVSVSSEGEQANSHSYTGRISADGRYVVFSSDATNLTALGLSGLFVRDRVLGTTGLVSPSGSNPSISADGRCVVFQSEASDLVPGDTNGLRDVFVRDIGAGTTERINVSTSGEQDTGDAGLWMSHPITADGRCVIFSSIGALVLNDTNGAYDGYLRDRVLAATECITLDTSGIPVGGYVDAISADGRFVVFSSAAPGIVPEDTDEMLDVFVRDRQSGAVELVSVDSNGQPLHKWTQSPAISADGRYVAFGAFTYVPGYDPEPQQVYVRDLMAETTEIVSVPDGDSPPDDANTSYAPALSADGRYVVFASNSPDLVPGDNNRLSDVFVRDRLTRLTTRINVSASGEQANDNCSYAAITDDGQYIAFDSEATNLVPGDTNEAFDVFVCFRPGVPIFPDVLSDHWAFEAVAACVDGGIVTGYPDGAYHPGEQVSRDQMAVYMARALAGGDAFLPAGPATATFPDVPTDHWAYKHVEYCCAQGIVGGYWDGYHPHEIVNRAQMAACVARAVAGGDESIPTPPAAATFSDVPPDHWAYKHVEYCYAQGIAGGYLDGYHPDEIVDRAQTAVYVQRAFALPM